MIAIPNMKMPKSCNECMSECINIPLECYPDGDTVPDCPLVEIDLVRCEECLWWKPVVYSSGEGGMVCVQTPLEPATKPDDFCSYGERKANGDI